MKVLNKVFVVTGAGNGIGRLLALDLLGRGARVALVDVNEPALQSTFALAKEYAEKISIHLVDITNRKGVMALPDAVIDHHGTVDGVINNAGIVQPFHNVKDLEDEAIDRVINVNFHGTVNVTRAFLPYLLQRPEAYIANVSSMGGFVPVPGQTIYGAAKAAVKLFTEGLRSELAGTAVTVSVIFPGAIDTDIVKNSGAGETQPVMPENASFKLLSATKAASIIIDGIERKKSRIMVGNYAWALDIFSRLSPRFAASMVLKKLKELTPKSN